MPFTIGSMAEQQWNFSASQWLGLMATGEAAAAVSFVANGCVLILHAFMTWYRPAVVNRLSLRMIVVSVIFNMVYCACQLVTDDISNQSKSCRIIAYVLIASDTMACMCLAMVGLNLVMIFVLKVSRSIKIEILYYFIVLASGVIVCVVPLFVGTPKGPKNKREEASCWYHYYFNGRINNIFNWMWYYAWLLFSSVFAALCAAISIRFVVKKQENFNGALDMFTKRNQKDIHTMAIIKRYAADNTDVFQKIARRCICYPIVPLISKSWGIGIEIAATQKATVPYAIYVIDRAFSCLLGFMISCIYFTDPAIRAVTKESIHKLKQRYVYDYFAIKYQPGTDHSVHAKSQYPKILKIVPFIDNIDHTPEYIQEVRNRYFSQDLEVHRHDNDAVHIKRSMLDPLEHHIIDPTQFQSRPPSHKPEVPTITIKTVRRNSDWEASPNERRYSVLNATSVNGNTYIPNEEPADISTNSKRHSKYLHSTKGKTIPMHRVDNTIDVGVAMTRKDQYSHQHRYLKHTERVETLVPYKSPAMAKMIHWMLVTVFRVKAEKVHHDSDDDDSDDDLFTKSDTRQDGPSRMFRDYTDGSDPGSPKLMRRNDSISFHPDVELKSVVPLSKISPLYTQHGTGSTPSVNIDGSQPEGSANLARKMSMPEIFRRVSASKYAKSLKEGKSPEFPLRRASSINVATLQWDREKKKPMKSASIQTSPSEQGIPINKPASSIGLSKMLNRGRSMSFSWSRLTNTKGKYNVPASPLNTEPLSVPYADSVSSVGNNSHRAAFSGVGSHTRPSALGDAHQEQDHISMTDKSVDQHSNNIAEPELSYYPKELSPRPRSQYRKPPTVSKMLIQVRRESTTSILPNSNVLSHRLSKRKQTSRRSSIISDSEQSLCLNELFYNVTPADQNVLELDNLTTKHDSMQSELSRFESDKKSPEIKRISDLSMDQQEGFAQGYTTIEFISNWQESNINDDLSRIIGISEPWDLRQQLKQQFELADEIAHM
ncbi:hypothetical protein HMPREF1544_12170 [Mucor circinelloides 1006PhL]|uniref:Uncharacterized protein n=1 Tax=Mucor circinelloides f. circinelloides (strain 1006PhL) TaxID=1220926 RepID=S2IU09_MUCC1|nr:hypothetical protein HMPREF1544_12170 [Mucor circinelloides 1006PhL]